MCSCLFLEFGAWVCRVVGLTGLASRLSTALRFVLLLRFTLPFHGCTTSGLAPVMRLFRYTCPLSSRGWLLGSVTLQFVVLATPEASLSLPRVPNTSTIPYVGMYTYLFLYLMQAYIHTYICIYMQAYSNKTGRTYLPTHLPTYLHTCIHILTRAYILLLIQV